MKNIKSFLLLMSTILTLAGCGKSSGGYDTSHVHKFGEWTITAPATCTEDGSKTRECSCGLTETEKIEALGHDFVANDIAPSCENDGTTGRTVCSRCELVGEEGTVAPATGHHYDNRGLSLTAILL